MCVNTKISNVCAFEQAVLIKRETVSLPSSFCKSLCEGLIAVEKIQLENRNTKIFIYDLYRPTFLVQKPKSPPSGCC